MNEPGTGTPATRNIYLTPQAGEAPDAVVPDLMRRGVTFVVCNVAVKNLAKKLAPAGASPDAIRDELAGGLIPGAVLVPDVFVRCSGRRSGESPTSLRIDRDKGRACARLWFRREIDPAIPGESPPEIRNHARQVTPRGAQSSVSSCNWHAPDPPVDTELRPALNAPPRLSTRLQVRTTHATARESA